MSFRRHFQQLQHLVSGTLESHLIFLCTISQFESWNANSKFRSQKYFTFLNSETTAIQEWPVCFWAVASHCDLLQEAEKFMLRQPTFGHTPHYVLPALEQKDAE